MSNNWNANISVIKEKFPGLAEQLIKESNTCEEYGEQEADIKIEILPSGTATLSVRGIYAHSQRDPVREGIRLAETLTGKGAVIMLGFGLGYTAEAVAKKAEKRPIIIAESNTALLKKALKTRDLRNFLSESNLIFILGGSSDGILSALQFCEKQFQLKGEEPVIIRNRAIMKLDENWFAGVERNIKAWTSKDSVNAATLKRFGKRWVRNLARNISSIKSVPGIERLSGILRETSVPIFLAAAGPSLDELIPFLPEIHKRCVTIAVDTSLRLLLSAGINPDFVLSVDPQYWNSKHLDRATAPHTCLIAESAVYPSVLLHNFERVFLCSSLFPLGSFIEDRIEPKGRLGAGGSVATTAWDFARVLGSSSVWIAGLDLSFPDLKTHFKGAVFEERALSESNRFNTAESLSFCALRDGAPFFSASANGKTVLTDKRLSLYALWFENRFNGAEDVRTYRLSDKGLTVSGSINATTEELLALPVRREEINQILSNIFRKTFDEFNNTEKTAARALRYKKALEELLKGLEEIKILAEDTAEFAHQNFIKFHKAPPAPQEQSLLLKKLDENIKRINESPVKDVASFLLTPLEELKSELESPESETFIYQMELSSKLYQSLASAVEYNLKVLKNYGKE